MVIERTFVMPLFFSDCCEQKHSVAGWITWVQTGLVGECGHHFMSGIDPKSELLSKIK